MAVCSNKCRSVFVQVAWARNSQFLWGVVFSKHQDPTGRSSYTWNLHYKPTRRNTGDPGDFQVCALVFFFDIYSSFCLNQHWRVFATALARRSLLPGNIDASMEHSAASTKDCFSAYLLIPLTRSLFWIHFDSDEQGIHVCRPLFLLLD